ncbi:nucleotide sugar dehydrogenase [Candidatus Pelagibacter sp.]|nr:nucleotide sugar dehydrogenase [Candidatus Pelagibacter sp.]
MLKPCIIGLGYVGLPILLNLSKKIKTIGFDINKKRILDLKNSRDTFNEFKKRDFAKKKIFFTNDVFKAKSANFFIVAVPTPISKSKYPDLSHLKKVSENISKILKKGDIIFFESTVYPGVTNNLCKTILEKKSKLIEGKDFFIGYSPERVNPGDKNHSLKRIDKILAYPHKFKIKNIFSLYKNLAKKIIFTKNIEEAETAKVIENIQRDVNIGLMNEIFTVCKKLNINFYNVLNLAATKWNFIKYKPGLVGGHCLPVDPYYLSYISKVNKFDTKIILAGRSINNSMKKKIYTEINKLINKKIFKNKKILLCGLTYKENVADLRNSMQLEIFKKLKKNKKNIFGFDPILNRDIVKKFNLISKDRDFKKFDIYIILTNHSLIKKKLKKLNNNKFIFNIFNNDLEKNT